MSRNRKRADQRFYMKKWIEKKIKATIRKQNESELGYYHFKNVLSMSSVDDCLPSFPAMGNSVLESGRNFHDGTIGLTKFVRNKPIWFKMTQPKPEETLPGTPQEPLRKFGEFYLMVAAALGLEGASLYPLDKCVIHSESLLKIQGFHVDANRTETKLFDGNVVPGHGEGFTAFLGFSNVNSLWIAGLSEDNSIINKRRILFDKGDCIVLPFGTLHAGDRNDSGFKRLKLFSEVFTKKQTDSTSQLWVVNEKGFTKQKQYGSSESD